MIPPLNSEARHFAYPGSPPARRNGTPRARTTRGVAAGPGASRESGGYLTPRMSRMIGRLASHSTTPTAMLTSAIVEKYPTSEPSV